VDTASVLPLLYNGALLLALAFVYDTAVTSLPGELTWRRQVLIGVGVGAIVILVMLTPWQYIPGIIFDMRSVLLSLSGLFFGFIPTTIAMTMAVLLRVTQGGGGALMGVIVIVTTGLIGVGWRMWRKPALAKISWGELYLFGLVVHIVMLMATLALPAAVVQSVLRAVSVPVLVIYPVATMLVGRLLSQRKRRELDAEALQISEERYRSYVDNAPYGVFVFDEQGAYQEVNPAGCRITGYTEAELLTKRIAELLPEAQEAFPHLFQQVQREGYAYGEYPFQRKDGSRGWWSIAAVKLSATRILGYVADLTAARAAEAARQQSEERFRHVAASISDIAYSCVEDDTGAFQLEWMSGAVERITGYTVEEMLALRCWGNLVIEEDQAIFEQSIMKIGIGDVRNCELRLRHLDGRIIWGAATAECVAESARRRLYGAIVDISARKQAEEALRRSEQTALALLNATDDAVFLLDTHYKVLACNVELLRRLNRSEAETLGRTIFDLLPPEVAERRCRYMKEVLRTRAPLHFEDEHSGLIIHNTTYPILDAQGEVVQIAVFGRDVTHQRESEERYQTLFREMLDGFALHEIICDEHNKPVDYRFIAVNPAFERLTGLRAEDVVGRTVREVLPTIEPYWIETYGRVALTREPIHLENFSQSLDRHFEVTAFSPAPKQFATIFVDVTVRKRAEHALQRRDALLEALSYAAGSFLQADSLEQVIPPSLKRLGEAAAVSRAYLFQNEEAADGDLLTSLRFEWCAPGVASQQDNPLLHHISYRAIGFTRWVDILTCGEIISGYVKDLPEAEKQILSDQDIVALIVVPVFVERRWWGFVGFERCDSEYVWSEAEVEALRAVSRALGVTIENLASRSRIQQQADELAQIMNGVPEGLLLLSNAGHVLSANPHARQYLSWLTGDAECNQVRFLGDRSLASLLTSPTDRWGHLVHAGQRTFEVLAQLVEHASVSPSWVLVIRDITDELFVQQQLQRQERLAAVGQLAAGIAHDFNNLMSVIILYAQLAAQSESLDERDRQRMNVIEEQGQRASQMIRQILDFSRRTTIERHPLDLLPLFKEQIKLLQRTLPENIQISLDTPLGECFVLGDPTRLEQVLMNLAVNARDAMPDGGRLCIGVETLEVLREKEAPLPGMTPGQWVRLTISDTGIGIPDENMERLFEPFFSTKPIGVGTGLGLPQVHGIVGQHSGHITVASEVGAGTVFTIYLPALAMLTPETTPARQVTQHVHGHGETILVVEDEASLRSTLTEVLEQWHYHVVAVANGKEALNALERGNVHPDLILSDVVMPEMSGLALFKALRQRKSDTPFIFLTGHLRGEELENLRQHGLRAWLPKPPGIEQLAETIAAVLQERSEPSPDA